MNDERPRGLPLRAPAERPALRTTISLQLPPGLAVALERAAEGEMCSRSAIVRKGVAELLRSAGYLAP